MAKSINEVYNEMIQVKEAIPELDGLTTSNGSVWKLLLYIPSVVIATLTQLFDLFKKDIEGIRDQSTATTIEWWNYKLINHFQYDPTNNEKGVLIIDTNLTPYYFTTDTTKRIVKFCSTKRGDKGGATIKVAKDNGSGQPMQLTPDELSASISYVRTIQGAGDTLSVVSFPPDDIDGELTVFADGQYSLEAVKVKVQTAITSFFQNIEYDGTILIVDLMEYIKVVEGVKNIVIKDLKATPQGGATKVFNTVSENYSYNTQSGYAILNPNFKINMSVYNG